MTTETPACCAPFDATVIPDADVALAAACAALSDPARVRILRRMAASPATCSSLRLAADVGLTREALVEHLRVLRAAGFVQGVVDGAALCFCLKVPALNAALELTRALVPAR